MKFDKKIVGLAMATIASAALTSPAHAALCEYVVQSEWNNGFVAAVRITNNTTTPINGWNVNWAYTDDSRRTSGWNANVSGNNPYSASGVGWNDTIYPGQSVEFGIQGTKSNNAAQRPVVTGAVCNNASSAAPIPSSSSRPSSSSVAPASSSIAPSSSSVAPSSSSIRPSSVSSSRSSVSSSPSSASEPSSSAMSSYIYSMPASSSSMSSAVSSSASSRSTNIEPVPNLTIEKHGLTLHVNGRDSYDADGDALTHTISIHLPTGTVLAEYVYPEVWYSLPEAGSYFLAYTLSDGYSTTTEYHQFTVENDYVNQPPVVRLTTDFYTRDVGANAQNSYDPEGSPLTFEWDYGHGVFIGAPAIGVPMCTGFTGYASRVITLTVSDGDLKTTVQRSVGGQCGYAYDVIPKADFTYIIDGHQVSFDATNSRDEIRVLWDFGDGHTAEGLLTSHTYATPGTYIVTLRVQGPSLFSDTKQQTIVIEAPASSSASSQSSIASSTSSSVSSAPSSSSSSQASYPALPNHYYAPRATIAPVIDGVADAIWSRASWTNIDVFWLGTQPNPSAEDYSGRYKALWDENYLYLLVDITDDVLYDGVRDPLDRYWEDDTVELFIDEDKSGGDHGYSTNAWAYHISTLGDVVDITNSGAKLLNDHITVKRVSQGSKHLWELRISIYGDDYADWKPVNVPRTLFSGKIMGFSASYIDNDGSPQRESMMGSVNTQGHKNNQGYLNADVFGSLQLVD